MTIDEKLDTFYASAIDDATAQSSDIISEYEKSLKSIYDAHKEEVSKKAKSSLQAETEALIREKNRTLANINLDIKRRISEKNEELISRLFQDVLAKLNNYMKTEDYVELLKKQIEAAKAFAKGESMTVYLNPSDSHLKTRLEEQTKTTLTISDRDFTGGIRAVVHSKNVLIDSSFSSRLLEEKESFKFH